LGDGTMAKSDGTGHSMEVEGELEEATFAEYEERHQSVETWREAGELTGRLYLVRQLRQKKSESGWEPAKETKAGVVECCQQLGVQPAALADRDTGGVFVEVPAWTNARGECQFLKAWKRAYQVEGETTWNTIDALPQSVAVWWMKKRRTQPSSISVPKPPRRVRGSRGEAFPREEREAEESEDSEEGDAAGADATDPGSTTESEDEEEELPRGENSGPVEDGRPKVPTPLIAPAKFVGPHDGTRPKVKIAPLGIPSRTDDRPADRGTSTPRSPEPHQPTTEGRIRNEPMASPIEKKRGRPVPFRARDGSPQLPPVFGESGRNRYPRLRGRRIDRCFRDLLVKSSPLLGVWRTAD
jgi:hypothetical protein